MKNNSSLKVRMWELFPLLRNKITVPATHPYLNWTYSVTYIIIKVKKKKKIVTINFFTFPLNLSNALKSKNNSPLLLFFLLFPSASVYLYNLITIFFYFTLISTSLNPKKQRQTHFKKNTIPYNRCNISLTFIETRCPTLESWIKLLNLSS